MNYKVNYSIAVGIKNSTFIYWPGWGAGNSGASTSGISTCGINCISICSPRGEKMKKGINYRKGKGKKSIAHRTLQRCREDMWLHREEVYFLPSSTLACSSPFPICPCWSFSASLIWKSKTQKKLMVFVSFIPKKKRSTIRNGSSPNNFREKYSHSYFENFL